MNQRQVIVAVVVVGLVSAAVWAWHESSQQQDAALAPAKPSAQLQDSFHNRPSAPVAPSEPAPAAASPSATPPAPPPAAPEANESAVSAQAQVVPPNVDTPEPAERKFARGGRADNSDQTPN